MDGEQLTIDQILRSAPAQADITGGKHGGNENSAAAHAETNKQRDRERILQYLEKRGSAGATCEQISVALSMPYQTASGRLSELKGFNGLPILIVQNGERRPTSRGCSAAVVVLAGCANDGQVDRQ